MAYASLITWGVFALFFAHLVLSWFLERRQQNWVTRHQYHVPAAFQGQISEEEHLKSARYTLAKSRLNLWVSFVTFIEACCWIFAGGLSLLNALALDWAGDGLWGALVFVALFVLVHSVIQSPSALLNTFVVEAQFGFNRSSLRLWLIDQVKGLVLGLLIGLPLLAVILSLMQSDQPLWWLWAWGFWLVFQSAMMVIAPKWLMPLFNEFKPIETSELTAKAENLMDQVGFKAKDFQVMDASRRSTHSNAFFTGLGREKRVVFYDTLLEKLNHNEVLAVLAHELGHFKLKHVPAMLFTSALSSGLFLALVAGLLKHPEWMDALGTHVASDRHVPVMLLMALYWILPPLLFFFKPLSAYWSRRREFQADAFAKQYTNAQDLGQALVKLYRGNASTLTPDPLYVWFHHSHPPALTRLAHLNA